MNAGEPSSIYASIASSACDFYVSKPSLSQYQLDQAFKGLRTKILRQYRVELLFPFRFIRGFLGRVPRVADSCLPLSPYFAGYLLRFSFPGLS